MNKKTPTKETRICVNCFRRISKKNMFHNEKSTMILPENGWYCKDADACCKAAGQ